MEDQSGAHVARAGRRAGRTAALAMEAPAGGDFNLDDLAPSKPRQGFGLEGDFTAPVESSYADSDGPSSSPPPRQQTSDPRPPPALAPDFDPLKNDSSGKTFEGVSRRKQQQIQLQEEAKKQHMSKYDELADADIMEIPELEEEGKEDMTHMVADAPKVRFNKVQDLNELEDEMQFRLPNAEDRDIDLSLLTAVLCPSDQVQEGDECWDPEVLLNEVASDLNAEKEKAEGITDGDGGDEVNVIKDQTSSKR